MRIKFTLREDRISMNRSNRGKQMMNMKKTTTCRLVGHKQMRKVRRRSVGQAHHQSFDGTRLLDVHLVAAKRVACLSSIGSELSFFSRSS